jgi:hypothetical protein
MEFTKCNVSTDVYFFNKFRAGLFNAKGERRFKAVSFLVATSSHGSENHGQKVTQVTQQLSKAQQHSCNL